MLELNDSGHWIKLTTMNHDRRAKGSDEIVDTPSMLILQKCLELNGVRRNKRNKTLKRGGEEAKLNT